MELEGLSERLSKIQAEIKVAREQMEISVRENRAKVQEARNKLYEAEAENRRKAQQLYGVRPGVMVVDEYTEYVKEERGF